VEESIDQHYSAQIERLGEDEQPLRDTIEKFRLEEVEHRDIGLENGAEQAFGYRLLTGAIRLGCKVAIAVSERV
jgi:ubiquinone biosynthesis monooxygenase Coq7